MGWRILAATVLVGCAAPLEAPSAYVGERFLCRPEHAVEFDALVDDCRRADLRDGSCDGVASLKVDLTTQHAIIDSQLQIADYSPDPRDPIMRSLGGEGKSPYFNFHLSLGITTDSLSAGGETSPALEACRRPPVGSSTIGFDVRGASDTLAFNMTSCEVSDADGLRLTYGGDIVRGGTLEVCLFVLQTHVVP
jgi:hypothetical protein